MATENAGSVIYQVDIETRELVSGTKQVNIQLEILQKGFDRTDKDAKSLSDSIKRANGGFSGFAAGLKNVIAPLLGVASAMAALRKLVDVQRQFDILNAGLITATGSAKNAKIAFDALSAFAADTPYDLAQAVDGFTKLVNLGLTPSEAALQSYGNTASALGKDLNQMIEAVADAATGEFERLKEFGIRAKKEGDNVSLTFRGVTTTVKNNAAEIEGYLIALGQNEFAGAMAERMKTLDGAIANLGDSWDALFRNISDAGLGDILESSVRLATEALDELNAQLASGQLEGYLDAIGSKFDGWGSDIGQTLAIISDLFTDETGRWDALLQNNVQTMINTFKDFPENVRAFIQIMTVEVLAGFDKVTAYARAFNDGINAIFSDDTFEGVGARLESELAGVNSARESSLTDILAERDAALNSFSRQTAAADELRRTYDELSAARGGDVLAGFARGGSGGDGGDTESPAEAKARKRAEEKAKREAKKREELIVKAEQKARKEARERAEQQQTILGQEDPIAGEQQRFAQQIANLKMLNEAKLIEDQRYLDLKAQAEMAHDEQMKILQEENFRRQSVANELLLASLDQLQQGATNALVGLVTGASNGEDAIRSLATSILNEAVGALVQLGVEQLKNFVMGQTQQAAAAATGAATGAALTASYAPAAAAASIASFGGAAASGLAALASAIPTALGLFGGRQYGGPVAANGVYRINETGDPEVFNASNGQQFMLPNRRGEVVSNRDATKGGGANVQVNVINQTSGAQVQTQTRQTEDQQVIDIIVSDLMNDGKTQKAFSQKFGTKPVGR
ncbi:hypothetical protein D3C85_281260 [compost metagenome]